MTWPISRRLPTATAAAERRGAPSPHAHGKAPRGTGPGGRRPLRTADAPDGCSRSASQLEAWVALPEQEIVKVSGVKKGELVEEDGWRQCVRWLEGGDGVVSRGKGLSFLRCPGRCFHGDRCWLARPAHLAPSLHDCLPPGPYSPGCGFPIFSSPSFSCTSSPWAGL